MCSIEVRRNTGLLLGSAIYTEEEENRGVVRNELVLALADALPKGCLHLGCNVVDIAIDDCGENFSENPSPSDQWCASSWTSITTLYATSISWSPLEGKVINAGNGIATLSNGQVLQPKLLIGADGVNSKVSLCVAATRHLGCRCASPLLRINFTCIAL